MNGNIHLARQQRFLYLLYEEAFPFHLAKRQRADNIPRRPDNAHGDLKGRVQRDQLLFHASRLSEGELASPRADPKLLDHALPPASTALHARYVSESYVPTTQ